MRRLSCVSSVAVAVVAGFALVGLLLAWCASTELSSVSAAQSRAGQNGAGVQVSAGSEFTVCTATGDQIDPAIHGDVVVWGTWGGPSNDILGYNLSTGQEFTVCTARCTRGNCQ